MNPLTEQPIFDLADDDESGDERSREELTTAEAVGFGHERCSS